VAALAALLAAVAVAAILWAPRGGGSEPQVASADLLAALSQQALPGGGGSGSVYLRFHNLSSQGDLPGTSNLAEFFQYNEALSFTFSGTRPASSGGLAGGKLQIRDVTIVKLVDSVSVMLSQAFFQNEMIQELEIGIYAPGAQGTFDRNMTYRFYGATITGHQLNNASNNNTETLTIAFQTVEIEWVKNNTVTTSYTIQSAS
jgi:type VI secretion system Hcp family effector